MCTLKTSGLLTKPVSKLTPYSRGREQEEWLNWLSSKYCTWLRGQLMYRKMQWWQWWWWAVLEVGNARGVLVVGGESVILVVVVEREEEGGERGLWMGVRGEEGEPRQRGAICMGVGGGASQHKLLSSS